MPTDAQIESEPLAPSAGAEPVDPMHKGTLQYTKNSLIVLFSFLLWGDFVLNLMENVVPKVHPLQLKELGATNTVMGVLSVSLG